MYGLRGCFFISKKKMVYLLALISKALGHSNLAVTTQYLDLDVEEVAENLREYI
jgi:hypothetical protein